MNKRAFIIALLLTLVIGQAAAAVEPTTTELKHPSFAVKHPKLHKVGRKLRRCCQILLPVVQFVGGCAQIVTAVK